MSAAAPRRFVFSAALSTLIVAAVMMLAPAHAGAAIRPTVQEVSEGLTCQCGCGLTVANCNHPHCEFSVPTRGKIGRMLAAGESKAQVIAFFRAKYGEKVLSAPTTHGFNLLAWTIPFVAILFGGGLIAVTFGRWRKTEAEPPSEPAPESGGGGHEFAGRLRRQLEQELRDQDRR